MSQVSGESLSNGSGAPEANVARLWAIVSEILITPVGHYAVER